VLLLANMIVVFACIAPRNDPEGNVLSVRDQHYDVQFTCRGMGRLASRTQEGTTVTFEYDKEDALVAIHNEAGAVYRFTLDKVGNVKEESGFDGVLRKFSRDKAGRVVTIDRPDHRATDYGYDLAGRVVEVKYSDGTGEKYAYSADGALVEAINGTAQVKFERDRLGRIVKELQGEDSVETKYDRLGLRRRMKTSKGHELEIERNNVGDVVKMSAGGGPVAPKDGGNAAGKAQPWEARFTRDQLGLEMERTLPGGVRATWGRDNVGRPVRHEIWSSETMLSAKAYTWEPNDRLMISPKGRGEEGFKVSNDTKALTSRSAPVTDRWTDPGHPYDAAGGGRQYYVPKNSDLVGVGQ